MLPEPMLDKTNGFLIDPMGSGKTAVGKLPIYGSMPMDTKTTLEPSHPARKVVNGGWFTTERVAIQPLPATSSAPPRSPAAKTHGSNV